MGLASYRLPGHAGRMTDEEFRDALEDLGMTQIDASRFLCIGERTSRRWASGEIEVPRSVELLLKLMLAYELSPDDVTEISEGSS